MQENKTEQSFLVDVNEIQRLYLPVSKKRIRKLISTYLRTIRVGNKLFVERKQLEDFLKDPDRDCFCGRI